MSESTDVDSLNYITNQIYIYGYGFIVVSGLFGNILNIIVFSKKIKDSVCSFYLLVVDVSNTIGILIYNLTIVIQLTYGRNGSESSVSWCRAINYLTDTYTLFTPFALCLASIDRYFCSCRQPNRRQWSSMKVAKISLVSILLISLLLAIPDFIYWYIDNNVHFCFAEAIYYEYVSYFLFPVMVCFIPVIILSVSGYKTYQNLQTKIRPTGDVLGHMRKGRIDYQMARILLIQILCYFFQSMTLFLMCIYSAITSDWEKSDRRRAVEGLVQALAYSIYGTAQCIGFYIYYSQSAAFRANVKKIFIKERQVAARGTVTIRDAAIN